MRKIIGFIFTLSILSGYAQDVQFSQFYNSPMFINPAFTGSTECYRIGTTSRSQWTGLQNAYNTALVFADLNYADLNSGFGFMASYDHSGEANLTQIDLSALYSYQVAMGKHHLRLGLQGTYSNRRIEFENIIFEDQFDSDLNISKPVTDDPIKAFNRTNFADFSAGALFYKENAYWVGFAAHHLNEPKEAFYRNFNSKLPIRYSVQLGYRFEHVIRTISSQDYVRIYPSLLFKSQAGADQLDLGTYAYFNHYMIGLFYRGLITKKFETDRNNDALTIHLGYGLNSWQFFYSYDFTTSKLTVRETNGSHEITLIHKFCLDWPKQRKVHKTNSPLPCPDFEGSGFKKHRRARKQEKALKKKNVFQNRGR